MSGRLSGRDYERLLRSVTELQRLRSLSELQQTTLRVIGRLIPALHLTYNELEVRTNRALAMYGDPTTERASVPMMPLFAQLMGEHPVLNLMQRDAALGRHTAATRITDLVRQHEFLKSRLYHDCYRHLDTRYQLILPLVSGSVTVGVALSRDRKNFSARECEMLELLRPHFVLAYQAMRERARVMSLFDPGDDDAGTETLRTLGFTPRQARVLFWACQGKTSPEIAIILRTRRRTVDKHLENIYLKLGVPTRAAAVQAVLHRLLGSPRDSLNT
jgi:DNA-binding CsgD family transcriptional regulator